MISQERGSRSAAAFRNECCLCVQKYKNNYDGNYYTYGKVI